MGFSDYLKDVEREMDTISKKKTTLPFGGTVNRPPVLKRPVVETVVEEDYELDEYLVENEWKFRNNNWVDPITKNRLIYEAAYAVQQERDRMGSVQVVETVSRQQVRPGVAQTKQPPLSVMNYAASVLSEDGDTLYENESVAQAAMYSGKFSTPVVGDVPVQQDATEAFYGGEEARMLAEAEAQAFSDGASMSGTTSAPRRSNVPVLSHASSLF